MAKKRSVKKVEENEHCKGHCMCCMASMKLAVVAFVLFLLTVWGGLRVMLLNIHWGIYLAITILLIILPMFCRCRKK
jgi:hypothetical protein